MLPASSLARSVALGWHLTLFGSARLVVKGANDSTEYHLERKTAVLLAFLALEGPTSRSKLAGLLWADSTEDTARGNLRQCLFRLRVAVGRDLIVSNEALRLEPSLEIDAVRFESLIFTGEFEAALQLELGGELLAGHDYDDSPDLNDWVLAARERLEAGSREALSSESSRLEIAGDYSTALRRAEQLLTRNPISEDANRRVMRLHYLAGDRPAALKAFEQCKTMLEAQLGVEPLIETQNLAALISSGQGLPQSVPPTRINIPIRVLRPPVLAGREREWAQLEAAWEARQVVFISGTPGSGKSRLMLDFAGSKGGFSAIEGRSGDASVPYSTHARNLKRTLTSMPELLEQLEPWVRRELSRLLPELELEAPTPIRDETEKLRFFQAIAHLTQRVVQHGHVSIVLDDLQFMDTGSFEVGTFIASRSLEDSTQFPRSLNAFRSHELTPEVANRVQELVESGHAVLIELKPLSEDAVGAMLGGIEVANLERLAPALTQYTGGNPMFIVETIKHLIETNQMSNDFPTHLPPPGKVGSLIRRRLERLTSGALRLAQVAAVAGTDFTLGLATSILELGALELSEPLHELEMAQVLVGERFAHDLIFEATCEGMPVPIKNLVHKSTAAYLEINAGNPARIAYHWLRAGEDARAVPHLLIAGEQAGTRYENRNSAANYGQAAAILESLGETRKAFEAYQKQVEMVSNFDLGELHGQIVEKLTSLALTTNELCAAWTYRSKLLSSRNDGAAAEQAARTALSHAEEIEDSTYKLNALNSLKNAILIQGGRTDELSTLTEQSRDLAEAIGLHERIAESENDLGVLLGRQDQNSRAILHYQRAIEAFRQTNNTPLLANALSSLVAAFVNQGLTLEALQTLDEVQILLEQIPDDLSTRLAVSLNRNAVLLSLNRYTETLILLQELDQVSVQYLNKHKDMVDHRRAEIFLELGQFETVQNSVNRLLEDQDTPRGSRIYALIYQSRIQKKPQGLESINIAERLLVNSTRPLAWVRLWLAKTPLLPASEGLELAQHCHEILANFDHPPLNLTKEIRYAQCCLELGRVQTAFAHSTKAIQLLDTSSPEMLYKGEVLFTHYRALEANRHENAKPFLEQILSWLLEVSDNHVPPEFREGFLTRNPINAAILEAAQNAGLEFPSRVTLQ